MAYGPVPTVARVTVWQAVTPDVSQASPQRARRFRRLSVGWLVVYDAAWLWSAGLWWQGFTVIVLLGLVVLSARGAHDKPAVPRRFIDELTSR